MPPRPSSGNSALSPNWYSTSASVMGGSSVSPVLWIEVFVGFWQSNGSPEVSVAKS